MSKLLTLTFDNGYFTTKFSEKIPTEDYEIGLVYLELKTKSRDSRAGADHQIINKRSSTSSEHRVYVKCDVINNSYFNGEKSQILYSFNWDGNEEVTIEPQNLIFLPIFLKHTQEINIKLVNKNSKILTGISGEMSLYLRKL